VIHKKKENSGLNITLSSKTKIKALFFFQTKASSQKCFWQVKNRLCPLIKIIDLIDNSLNNSDPLSNVEIRNLSKSQTIMFYVKLFWDMLGILVRQYMRRLTMYIYHSFFVVLSIKWSKWKIHVCPTEKNYSLHSKKYKEEQYYKRTKSVVLML